MLQYEVREKFLSLFPPGKRSGVMNLFLYEIRKGAESPNEIYQRVLKEIDRRIDSSKYNNPTAWFDYLKRVLLENRDVAIEFAAFCLQWESLPTEEKDRIKYDRGEKFKSQWMDAQPPTEKQLALLKKLGYKGEVVSRLQASQLINKLLNKTA